MIRRGRRGGSPAGAALTPLFASYQTPALASEARRLACSSTRSPRSRAARRACTPSASAPDGTILDPAGLALATGANGEVDPAVASDGANYLVAWTDRRNGGVNTEDLRRARHAAGHPADAELGIAVAHLDPAAGSRCLARQRGTRADTWWIWTSAAPFPNSGIRGGLVANDGTVADPAGVLGDAHRPPTRTSPRTAPISSWRASSATQGIRARRG